MGLVVAGGDFGRSGGSLKVELSTDYGQTKTSLPDIPYGLNNRVNDACLVIVNSTTLFMAGGYGK